MAFKSKAQMAKFANMVNEKKITQKMFDEYASKTDIDSLPDRVGEKKDNRPKSIEELKQIAKRKLGKA